MSQLQNTLSLAATFAQNLLVARSAADLTQHALALASGISRATIAQLESGTGDPKLSTVEQLAEALHISPTLLLFTKPDLHALASISPANPAPPNTLHTMNHLVNSGSLRNRLEAANLGSSLARNAGLSSPTAAIAAAIASFHLPGPATLATAHLAHEAPPPS